VRFPFGPVHRNWKQYWSVILKPFLRGDVLEVGAGLGTNTRLLHGAPSSPVRRWVALEPDSRLLDQLRGATLERVEPRLGTLANLDASELFDTILYIDVLEHIPDDIAELRRAAAHLNPKSEASRLIVLSPAHPWLFSEFDGAIGHHRRYTRESLKAAAQGVDSLSLQRLWYLDSGGLLASAANRLLLRQSLPTLRQILFWDRVLVPFSRFLDPLLLHRLGKSVVAVWTRDR
jgi:SAM-dependent methyltransferase